MQKGFIMASIFSRVNKNGSTSYRVLIRRKNVPLLCLTFSSEKEAVQWAKENELNYIQNPLKYIKLIGERRLEDKRLREFGQKAIISLPTE